MAYPVIRTDNMAGTTVGTHLRSARVDEEIPNGYVVKLTTLLDGESELYQIEEPSASDDLKDVGIVATPEVLYDERKKNLDEFVNEAGSAARVYMFHLHDTFGLTEEGFTDDSTLEVGETVTLADGYQLAAGGSGTTVGTIIAIESESGYTYYVVRVDA